MRLDGVEAEAGREDAEVLEQVPLDVGEQAHAPVDRRAHRAVPLGQVAGRGGQQRQALPEALGDARGREQADPRRRELDRERQALEAPADVGDIGGVRRP